MQKKQVVLQYKWRVIMWFTLLQMIIVWLNSCTPQTDPIQLFPTREASLTIVPTIEIPTITIVPATITAISPTSTPIPAIPLEVETVDISNEFFAGTQYHFIDPIEPTGILPESGELLMLHDNDQLWAVNINNLTARVLAENVRWPIFAPSQANHLIFTRDEGGRKYSVWITNRDGSEPLLLGNTSGYFPIVSVTNEGKVLILEDGHLVLKWREGDVIQSWGLNDLELKLGLTWEMIEPNAAEYTPGIDFMISPDGQWVAVFDGEQTRLWLATTDGQTIQDIPINTEILERDEVYNLLIQIFFLSWSPDSQQLAYHEGYSNLSMIRDSHSEVKLVGMDSEIPVNITFAETTQAGGLDWSLDGQLFTFSSKTYASYLEPGSDLFIANADGSDIRQISNSFTGTARWRTLWIPNSNTLIYGCLGPEIGDNMFITDTCVINIGTP